VRSSLASGEPNLALRLSLASGPDLLGHGLTIGSSQG